MAPASRARRSDLNGPGPELLPSVISRLPSAISSGTTTAGVFDASIRALALACATNTAPRSLKWLAACDVIEMAVAVDRVFDRGPSDLLDFLDICLGRWPPFADRVGRNHALGRDDLRALPSSTGMRRNISNRTRSGASAFREIGFVNSVNITLANRLPGALRTSRFDATTPVVVCCYPRVRERIRGYRLRRGRDRGNSRADQRFASRDCKSRG